LQEAKKIGSKGFGKEEEPGMSESVTTGLEIAVIGMAGRFPGAGNIDEFWNNLKEGSEAISFFTDEELKEAGVSPELIKSPAYIKASGVLEDIECFDAPLFGYTPKEAEVMDPQVRIFHECVWTAIEDAGYDPGTYDGLIGLYAGASPNFHWVARVLLSGKMNEIGQFPGNLLTQKDYLSLRISYKLNLKGPSFTVHTACSTSLVAIHLACQAILSGECDMALAGGVTAVRLNKGGYMYQEGSIGSPDGHCRAFDAGAEGFVPGDGTGVVLLKRLEDALADRDHIYAVVKGSAINNDGIRKAGFTASSVEGQAEVIRMALQLAEVEPGSIGYIEAHGTATPLGDPVEIEALKLAFNTGKKAFCAIGSVKSNVGHLDSAAGVTGFIKAVLALKHRLIPPTLHFDTPNPRVDFINSPFYVNTALSRWENHKYPLRAGVSSFGLGGTNAHVVLEEAPAAGERPAQLPGSKHRLILLSAKTGIALQRAAQNLAGYLKNNPGLNPADAAYTLQVGRTAFNHRQMFTCAALDDAAKTLSAAGSERIRSGVVEEENRPVIFIFPGEREEGPSRYVEMGCLLYHSEAGFRAEVEPWLPAPPFDAPSPAALLVFEYALARLLMKWGIKPYALIGCGIGEYAAACLAGVFSPAQALKMAGFEKGADPAALKKPGIPLISNAAGEWMSPREAVSIGAWADRCKKNQWSPAAFEKLSKIENPILLQFAPDRALAALLNPGETGGHRLVNLVGNSQEALAGFELLLNNIGLLWLQGVKIDWQGFYPEEKRYRVSLPTYPFQWQRYHIDRQLVETGAAALRENAGENKEMADWFYLPSWKRSLLEPQKGAKPFPGSGGCWLVFLNQLNPGSLLVKALKEKGQDVVIVKKGHGFSRAADDAYTLDPRESSHYFTLFDQLQAENRLPHRVIHCWNVTGECSGALNVETFDEAQYSGFYSLLYTAKAIDRLDMVHNIHITVLTDHLQEVTGGEPLCPEKATLLGLVKAIPQEFPGITCCNIDIPVPEPGTPEETALIHALLEEWAVDSSEPVIAYRHNQRWVQIFDPLHLEALAQGDVVPGIKEKGVYLITGGLGVIGLIFSELLVKRAKARLVLTGRSPFPPRQEWSQWLDSHDESDPVGRKIKKLEELTAMGGEVLYFQADAADREKMRGIVTRAGETFGPVNGVIHAAGIIEGKSLRSVRELSHEDCQLQFTGKVYGTMVLEELFKNRELDFCWMLSSISCVLAGLGFGAYASANLFMDVFVKQRNRQDGAKGSRWFSLNWDGMDAIKSTSAFERMFSLEKADQLVVSRGGNLQARIEKWIKLQGVRDKGDAGAGKTGGLHPRPALSTPYQAPGNPVERKIAGIWQGMLGFDRIGIHDNFLELGGDSLTSITVISRIHQQLNVSVPLAEFFSSPTIKSISGYILKTEEKSTYVPLDPAEEKEYYALSSAQKRLYIIHQMDENSTNYNMPTILVLEGDLRRQRLEDTFRALINRHESLRTSFEMIDGEPAQKIHRQAAFKTGYYEVESEAEARKNVVNFIRPFDISRAPLLHVGLVKTGTARHLLMFDIHHIISDGISIDILINEFRLIYAGKELPPLKLQYRDYSQWHNSPQVQSKIKKQEEFWLKEFAGGIPVLNLPLDYPRPAVQGFEGSIVNFRVEPVETEALRKIAREQGTTLYTVFLTLFNVLFSKLGGQEDIVMGAGAAGRWHEGLQKIVGMFVNTMALRNYPGAEKTFSAFLNEVKERSLQAFENQDYLFEYLVEKVVPNRDRSRNPIFDVMFAFNNLAAVDSPTADIPELKLSTYGYNDKLSTSFDNSFIGIETRDHLFFKVEYSTKLFKRETIERFIRYLREIISAVIEDKDIQLKHISISHDLVKAKTSWSQQDVKGFKF
jgi:polyketide synthase PksN